MNLAGWVKKLTGKTVITVGSVGLDVEFTDLITGGHGAAGKRDIQDLLVRLANNEFDLVAVGRALLMDPEWAIKLRDGRLDEINDFKKEARDVLF